MPPAALPGAKLLKSLKKQVFMRKPDKSMFEGGYDLPEERGANRIRNLLSRCFA